MTRDFQKRRPCHVCYDCFGAPPANRPAAFRIPSTYQRHDPFPGAGRQPSDHCGDIALLRAAGQEITATARGYVIPAQNGLLRRIACIHSAEETRDELDAMVDCGCTVVDVIVEHPVYGQLTAPLHLSSRLDVDQFMKRMDGAAPLSQLTGGVHLHTLSCPDETAYEHLLQLLRQRGFLVE